MSRPLDEPPERDAPPIEVRRRFDSNIKLRPVAVDARARHRQQPGLRVRHEGSPRPREERPVRERAARAAGRVREGAAQQAHALHDAARERRFGVRRLGRRVAGTQEAKVLARLREELVQQLDDEPPRPLAVDADLEEAPGRFFASGASPVESASGGASPEKALRAARGVALVPAARVRAERAPRQAPRTASRIRRIAAGRPL